jgi:hypothetical protein
MLLWVIKRTLKENHMVKKIVLIFMLLILVLAACGDDDKDDKKDSATPTVESLPPFTETYTSETGITVQYPKGWISYATAGMNMIGNVELSTPTSVMTTGQAGLIVFDPMWADLVSAGEDISTSELLTRFIPAMEAQGTFGGGGKVTSGETTETTVGGHPAARIYASTEQMDGLVLAVDMGDQTLLMMGGSAKDEMSQFETVLLAIADTVTYAAK